jgi:HAD superfamily hydrolase (TIGR01490 family)
MTLALFDLDDTLLSGDSDHEWGNFLISKKLVDHRIYKKANDAFFAQYQAGTLDIFEYSKFSFQPLARHSMEELHALHEEFMTSVIRPLVGQKAKTLVQSHASLGHTLVVITATNSFITRPIVAEFGIEHLIATEVKIVGDRFVAEISGIPCFKEGKVQRLTSWLQTHNESLAGSFFYSDSINDLSMMELVETAIAVDPDPKLREIADLRQWKIISLRP